MEIFFWLFFGPFLSVISLVLLGGSIVYLALGIQNLVAGVRDKSAIKTSSGYLAVFLSLALAISTFLIWYFSGGETLFGILRW